MYFWGRCAAHALNLVVGDFLKYPLANQLVSTIERIVAYYRTYTHAMGALRVRAEPLGIKTTLHTACPTRCASWHKCLASLLKLESAFDRLRGWPPSNKITDAEVHLFRCLSLHLCCVCHAYLQLLCTGG